MQHGALTAAAARRVASEIDRLVEVALHPHPDPSARGALEQPPAFVTLETMQQERKSLLRELQLVEAERDQLKSSGRVDALEGQAWMQAIALVEQYKGDGMRLHAAVTRVAELLNSRDAAGYHTISIGTVRAALVDAGTCGLCGMHLPDGSSPDQPRISSVDPAWRTLAVTSSETSNRLQVVLARIESEIATWGTRDYTNEPEPFERRKGRALQDSANADAIRALLRMERSEPQPPLVAWDGTAIAFWYAVEQVRKQCDTEGEQAVLTEVLDVARHALALRGLTHG